MFVSQRHLAAVDQRRFCKSSENVAFTLFFKVEMFLVLWRDELTTTAFTTGITAPMVKLARHAFRFWSRVVVRWLVHTVVGNTMHSGADLIPDSNLQ